MKRVDQCHSNDETPDVSPLPLHPPHAPPPKGPQMSATKTGTRHGHLLEALRYVGRQLWGEKRLLYTRYCQPEVPCFRTSSTKSSRPSVTRKLINK
jgi:hypothetical protein